MRTRAGTVIREQGMGPGMQLWKQAEDERPFLSSSFALKGAFPRLRRAAERAHAATHFSVAAPPADASSRRGFWGGWGFCCSGGLAPGPPWSAGRGCWVVGAPPGRPCCPDGLCCGDPPPWDICLGGWLGLCCGGFCWPPGGFWPGPPGFCCAEADCCLCTVPGLRWGEPWPEGGLCPWPAAGAGRCVAPGPWPGLEGGGWLPGSLAAVGLAPWCGAGGWP